MEVFDIFVIILVHDDFFKFKYDVNLVKKKKIKSIMNLWWNFMKNWNINPLWILQCSLFFVHTKNKLFKTSKKK